MLIARGVLALFGKARAGQLRQLFDMSLELADRSAVLALSVDEQDLGRRVDEMLAAEPKLEEGQEEAWLRYLESLACGLAAASVAEGEGQLTCVAR